MIFPTLDLAESFSRERLEPMISMMPALKNLVADVAVGPDTANRSSIKKKRYPGGFLNLIGANSRGRTLEQARPCRDHGRGRRRATRYPRSEQSNKARLGANDGLYCGARKVEIARGLNPRLNPNHTTTAGFRLSGLNSPWLDWKTDLVRMRKSFWFLGSTLVACLGMLLLGIGVAWVRRGFAMTK